MGETESETDSDLRIIVSFILNSRWSMELPQTYVDESSTDLVS